MVFTCNESAEGEGFGIAQSVDCERLKNSQNKANIPEPVKHQQEARENCSSTTCLQQHFVSDSQHAKALFTKAYVTQLLGFRVQGLGFRDQGSWFRVYGLKPKTLNPTQLFRCFVMQAAKLKTFGFRTKPVDTHHLMTGLLWVSTGGGDAVFNTSRQPCFRFITYKNTEQ